MDKWVSRFCLLLSALLIISSVAMAIAVPTQKKNTIEYKFDMFDCEKLVDSVQNLELDLTSFVYVKNDAGEWEEYQRIHGDENRIWVSYKDVPQTLIDAFIAIEDERYLTHKGVDWKRTISAFGNLFFKYYSTNQGGSTITQQLVKNISKDKDTSASRKIREIVRSLYLETKLNKQQILEAYLNTIALGSNICGVEVAANYYFNKSVEDLTVAECASIAAITKNPSKYNPESNPNENTKRRNTVLKKMYELEKITEEEYNEAVDSSLELDFSQQLSYEYEINNYFVDALIDEIIQDFSEKYKCSASIASTMLYNGGYKIYSTLNPDIQEDMEDVYENVSKYFSQTDSDGNHAQSAMTIMDYEGHILGIVGGSGEKTQNRILNRATDSPRQPGSTMKPIGVYALAIEKNIVNYSSLVEDQPIENYYGRGKSGPAEWYGYYKGNITVQYALEKSANTIPVRLLKQMGIEKSYDFLTNSLNCSHLTEIDKNLSSLALGGCEYGLTTTESAAAYAIFGNGGLYYEPTTYYSVENSDQKKVLEYTDKGTQVISKETATIMNRLLQQVVYGEEGTGGGIGGYSGMRVYAKTGTSSESNDLWMVAGSPYYVGSVWYGFDTPRAIKSSSAAATVWRAVMKSVHTGLKYKDFTYGSGVYSTSFCTHSGLLPSANCTSVKTGYYKSGRSLETCDGVHIDTTQNPEGTETTVTPDGTQNNQDPQNNQQIVPPPTDTPTITPSGPGNTPAESTPGSSTGDSTPGGTEETTDGTGNNPNNDSSHNGTPNNPTENQDDPIRDES